MFFNLLFPKLALNIPVSIPLFMLFPKLGMPSPFLQIFSSFKAQLKFHFFFLVEIYFLFDISSHPPQPMDLFFSGNCESLAACNISLIIQLRLILYCSLLFAIA